MTFYAVWNRNGVKLGLFDTRLFAEKFVASFPENQRHSLVILEQWNNKY